MPEYLSFASTLHCLKSFQAQGRFMSIRNDDLTDPLINPIIPGQYLVVHMTADYCTEIPIVHFLRHSLCAMSITYIIIYPS